MSKHWFALLVSLLVILAAPTSRAQAPVEGESLDDPATEAKAFDIARRTMSPFCPGRTLADCPSGNATEWRQDIRAMLKEGKSPAEIQQVLNKRAGANLTGTPESSLGWMLPVGLCFGALVVLTLVLKRVRREDGQSAAREPGDGERGSDEDEHDTDQDDAGADGSGREAPKARDEAHERELDERLRRELADEEPG
jgi:cytochrome c-type biogenesis protein CcmH/NrfF